LKGANSGQIKGYKQSRAIKRCSIEEAQFFVILQIDETSDLFELKVSKAGLSLIQQRQHLYSLEKCNTITKLSFRS
jgi:hypothetical protein